MERRRTRCWRCASRSWSPTRSAPGGSPRRSPGCSARGSSCRCCCVRGHVLVGAGREGAGAATRSAFYDPGLLLLVFGLTVVSAGLHELGHAAATRYGGATPGAMGAGLYLVWPAFYTDVDDSYRLSRLGPAAGRPRRAVLQRAGRGAGHRRRGWPRARTRCCSRVATQLLQMLRQLAPVMRADGYHILADLTGVPDLFAHLGPTLRALVPGAARRRRCKRVGARRRHGVGAGRRAAAARRCWSAPCCCCRGWLATAWDSGALLLARLAADLGGGDVLGAGAGLLRCSRWCCRWRRSPTCSSAWCAGPRRRLARDRRAAAGPHGPGGRCRAAGWARALGVAAGQRPLRAGAAGRARHARRRCRLAVCPAACRAGGARCGCRRHAAARRGPGARATATAPSCCSADGEDGTPGPAAADGSGARSRRGRCRSTCRTRPARAATRRWPSARSTAARSTTSRTRWCGSRTASPCSSRNEA